jgi:uncharacterized protein (DUF58 family)
MLRKERETWLRFFVALGGLGLAFGLAVFSTLTRQAGQLWATAILASLALLLAGAVGLTSVPYLARRVALHRVRDTFDYRITREGLVYLALILVVSIAALNTGNNLLFIVVSAMLAAILASGVASAVMLRGLSVETSLPGHVFAGQPMAARLALRNRRKLLPAFSVSIVPPESGARGSSKKPGLLPRSGREQHALASGKTPPRRPLEPSPRAPLIFERSEYFPFLPAGGVVSREVELRFPRRGRYAQEAFGVRTRFPFSFLEKTRRVLFPQAPGANGLAPARAGAPVGEIIVYPSVEPTEDFFEILPMITGEFENFVRGRGHDLYRIRDYMPEDSARHVDWKATARSGALKVREFTREDERKLRIVFDNPQAGAVPEPAYERGVALAASLAWHFAAEPTELSFAAPGYPASFDVYEFLRYLALITPEAAAPNTDLLEDLPLTDDYNLVITARPRGSIPTALWTCSYFLFLEESQIPALGT